MRTTERTIIYGVLALLLAINLSAAIERGEGTLHAAAARDGAQLGPAESLTLTDDEHSLVLRNKSGRLAWADNEHARVFSIGFVHVGRTLGPLLEAEQYVDQRRELEEEIRAIDEEISQRIQAMGEQPDFDRASPEARRFSDEYRRWRIEQGRRMGKLTADQIEDAYRDLVAAVEVVAERRQIDLVFRFIPTDNDFLTQNPAQAYIAVRARIAVKYPEALNITDEVLEELAVE